MTPNKEFVCQRCGHCCMTAFMALENIPIGQDFKEVTDWFRLHHCETVLYESRCYGVKIPLVCQWLEYDAEQKEYYCKDYEHRPVVCKQYFCKKVKGDTVVELVK